MNLNWIQAFVVFSEKGSIQGAADMLGVNQSVVTKRIQKLETELGSELLDRGRRPPGFSLAGVNALALCRHILQGASRLRDIGAPKIIPAVQINIGLAHGIEDLALATPLDELRANYAWGGFRMTSDWSSSLVAKVQDGRLDAAIVLLPSHLSPPAGLATRLIGREQVHIVAGHSADVPENPGLLDLVGQHWILNGEGCGHRAALAEVLRKADVSFDVRVEAFDVQTQLSLVGRGAGLGLVGPRVLARSTSRDVLRIVHPRDFTLSVGIWCLERGTEPRQHEVMRAYSASIADRI